MKPVDQILRFSQSQSRGFLRDTRTLQIGAPATAALIGKYDMQRYDDALFAALGIHRPERLDSAVTKRRAEYLAGRVLAQTALSVLGRQPEPVLTGPNREPVWPQGVVGSITHSKGHCAVALSDNPSLLIGIDTEDVASGSALESIFHVALLPQEAAMVRKQESMPPETLATLVFSAKETLYKALFANVRKFFGFNHAELAATPKNNVLRLRLVKTLSATFPAGDCFDIAFELAGGTVLTWLVLPDPVR